MKTRPTQIIELRLQRLTASMNHKAVKPIDKKLVKKLCRQLEYEDRLDRRAS